MRLAGHRSKSAARPIRQWVDELRVAGLSPSTIPLRHSVPVKDLYAAEQDEITRRIVDGQQLLNNSGTAEGRGIVRAHEMENHRAALTAAWRELAEALRETLGGPVPPWPVTITLAGDTWQALQASDNPDPTSWALQQRADELVWRDIGEALPDFRDDHVLQEEFDLCLHAVSGTSKQRTDSTHVLAADAQTGRVELVTETMRAAALEALARYLEQVGQYGVTLLQVVRDPTAPRGAAGVAAVEVLRQIWV